jgi:hypothetical protein
MTPFYPWVKEHKKQILEAIKDDNDFGKVSHKLSLLNCIHSDTLLIRLHHLVKLKEKFTAWKRIG